MTNRDIKMFFSKMSDLISQKNKEIIYELQHYSYPLNEEEKNKIKENLELNDIVFEKSKIMLNDTFFDLTISPMLYYNIIHYNFYDDCKKKCLKIQSDFDIIEFLDYEKNCQVVFNLSDKVACINMDASKIQVKNDGKLFEALKYILKFCYNENSTETFDLISINFDFFPKDNEKEVLINFINTLKEIDTNINKQTIANKNKP